VPTTGFKIQEKMKLKRLNAEACNKYKVPFTYYNDLKLGKDYYVPETKQLIKNSILTFPATEPISYAYCSDTIFNENVIDAVAGVDILYHEATFMHDKVSRAMDTMHTTARQAGIIARNAGVKKLIIGHFSSRYEDLNELVLECKKEFENTELAIEGKTFVIE
jgi:ribonuclease Z